MGKESDELDDNEQWFVVAERLHDRGYASGTKRANLLLTKHGMSAQMLKAAIDEFEAGDGRLFNMVIGHIPIVRSDQAFGRYMTGRGGPWRNERHRVKRWKDWSAADREMWRDVYRQAFVAGFGAIIEQVAMGTDAWLAAQKQESIDGLGLIWKVRAIRTTEGKVGKWVGVVEEGM